MRSVAQEDATTRARIRDAAVARFGAQGFDRTSIRQIAADAGVSAGLVIHHFGSKDGLRRACDDWLVDRMIGEKRRLDGPAVSATIREWLDDPSRFRDYLDYVAMMLADGTPGGARLFDVLLGQTREMLEAGVADGSMHPSGDPDTRALLITVYGIAPLILRDHVARALGAPLDSAAALRRMTMPAIELHTHGLYTDSRMLDAARAALADTEPAAHAATPSRAARTGARVRSDKGPGNPNQDPDPPIGDAARD
ncbi:TetR family transcriptional regulator [Agromyces aurantiacus]|uniref:TetR family transcriptional regulator n=1 Tax=Agromyces aurantiacus TaxID=165814 RepID=A0ABV9R6J5_9MICO|nr:TetR family transcriptional regulator [Agromyces aurantiacus]MBM7504450.1 AcrR family transcriptional regulator [Agromyces aurantiacus]